MASVNKWIGIGNLGADPELRYSTSDDPVCNFRIACTESWKDKNTGEKKEATEWVSITAWRKLGEICGEYLKKGSQVYIEGKLKTEKYTDKDGVERYTTKVVAEDMKMLGSKGRGDSGDSRSGSDGSGDYSPAPRKDKPKPSFEDLGDDIPFNWAARITA
jgi:single-strand DNA-binding protein